MSPKFWENTTSQEQINEAEAKLQLSAAELLKEEKQNLWTGTGLSRNWKILSQISKWIIRSFILLLSEHFNGSFALNFNISKSSCFSYIYIHSLPKRDVTNPHQELQREKWGNKECCYVRALITCELPGGHAKFKHAFEKLSSRYNRIVNYNLHFQSIEQGLNSVSVKLFHVWLWITLSKVFNLHFSFGNTSILGYITKIKINKIYNHTAISFLFLCNLCSSGFSQIWFCLPELT